MQKMNDAQTKVIAIDIPMPGATFFGANNPKSGFMGGAYLGQAAIQDKHIVGAVTRKDIGIADGTDMIGKHIAPAQGFEQRTRHFGFVLEKQDSQ